MAKMIAVDSSSITAIGYDPGRAKLYVRFREKGRTYVYEPVDQVTYEALLEAPSKGAYLNQSIKGYFHYQLLH